ncbi:MAG: hypothetical protein WB611_26190 [Stellaceae bacterium]
MPVQVFNKGDSPPPFPRGLSDFSVQGLRLRYGIKASTDKDGNYFWEAATEEDYRKAEAERLGIREEDVTPKLTGCYQTGPIGCEGDCDAQGFCKLLYRSSDNHYYCNCV